MPMHKGGSSHEAGGSSHEGGSSHNAMMKPKMGGYMSPYSEGSIGKAVEACYNACQTCKYAMDHRMMLQCCHPKRATLIALDIQGRPESEEGFKLQDGNNYCVEPGWWCKYFEASDIDNSPAMYGGGAVGGAAVGGTT